MGDRAATMTQLGSHEASGRERRPSGRRTSDQELDRKAIAAKIAHTQREIAATLTAIVDRLSPERLADEALAAATKAAEQASDAADAMATDAIDEAEAAVRKLVD